MAEITDFLGEQKCIYELCHEQHVCIIDSTRGHCSQRSNRADVEHGAPPEAFSRECSQIPFLLEPGEGAAVLSGHSHFFFLLTCLHSQTFLCIHMYILHAFFH